MNKHHANDILETKTNRNLEVEWAYHSQNKQYIYKYKRLVGKEYIYIYIHTEVVLFRTIYIYVHV